jgi:hypothetical protein
MATQNEFKRPLVDPLRSIPKVTLNISIIEFEVYPNVKYIFYTLLYEIGEMWSWSTRLNRA